VSSSEWVRAFAPGSIGNVAVGFDMLGLAIRGAGDHVEARRTENSGLTISSVKAPDGGAHADLSADPDKNTASIAAASLWSAEDATGGIELVVEKGVPLFSGMGSSAASAVAAVVAVNELLEKPLPMLDLLPHALAGEAFASGGMHADNVAPSLLGGLVYCPPLLLPQVLELPTPIGLSSVLVHPELRVSTAESRGTLADHVHVDRWLEQQAAMGGFIAACYRNDTALLASCLKDLIIEPQRASAVTSFAEVKAAAIDAGALGCSLSGSGPSVFALCPDYNAAAVATAMQSVFNSQGIDNQVWTSPLDCSGAVVESETL